MRANLRSGRPSAQVTFNVPATRRFLNQPDGQNNKEQVQTGVNPEGVGITRAVEHGQECCADNCWQSSWLR